MRVSRDKKLENHEEEIKIDDEDGSYKAGGAMSFNQDFSLGENSIKGVDGGGDNLTFAGGSEM